jgi:sugar (pentulose or hexulose) kinase
VCSERAAEVSEGERCSGWRRTAVQMHFSMNALPQCHLQAGHSLHMPSGLLEGMSRIEADAYRLLTRLGASPVKGVLTAGGGAVNDKWTAMRAAAIGVPVAPSNHGEWCCVHRQSCLLGS